LRYFGEFLSLEAPYIFKHTLGKNDIEMLIIKTYRRLEEVGFKQIRRWIMYGDVNTIIFDIRAKERHQRGWPAANIKQRTRFSLCDPIHDLSGLFEAIVRSVIF
jgi:hypothetical protein